MTIRFRCDTITAYDPAARQYVRRERVLTAPEGAVGTFLVCPGCKQRIQVPPLTDSRLAAGSTATPDKSAGRVETVSRQATASPAAAATTASSGGGVAAEPTPLSFSSFATTVRCKQCGGHLGPNRCCVQCGYQAVLGPSQWDPESNAPQQAGFQRWLASFVQQGNARGLLNALHIMVAVVLGIVVVMGMMGGSFGLAVALAMAGGLGLCYLYLVYDSRRIARNPTARLSWWQQAGWQAILSLCRSTRWRFLGSGTAYRILDLRGQPIAESQLLARTDLVDYEVIDAEGVPLSDAGLAKLKGLRRLRRLVVRGSGVSPAAVFRLQQALPETWIWN